MNKCEICGKELVCGETISKTFSGENIIPDYVLLGFCKVCWNFLGWLERERKIKELDFALPREEMKEVYKREVFNFLHKNLSYLLWLGQEEIAEKRLKVRWSKELQDDVESWCGIK